MTKEEQIIQLLQSTDCLSAREITDRLYGKNQHQSNVFGCLQNMESKGIVRKDKSKWPYGWLLVNGGTSAKAPVSISQKQTFIPNTPKVSTASTAKTVEYGVKQKKYVALISCTGSKRGSNGYSCEARLLYDTSQFFPISLAYAEIVADDIYIISAEYHLLELDKNISWYNKTLNDFSYAEKIAWGNTVIQQLSEKYDISETEFIILAGQKYYQPISKGLPHAKLPLRNANGFAKQKTERENLYMCARLHKLFNRLPRLHWDAIDSINFDNGIYIVFEDGEAYYGMDRIVHVGTHDSNGRLRQRLKDHFISENKDGSIFRKNIGKAMLSKNKNSYLEIWSMNSSNRGKILQKIGDKFNPVFQNEIEKDVSAYMREHLSFVCFPVETKDKRLRLKEGIIALLNISKDFSASIEWKGRFSPEHEINQSGMWLKKGLDGIPLSEKEFTEIEAYCLSISPSQGQ